MSVTVRTTIACDIFDKECYYPAHVVVVVEKEIARCIAHIVVKFEQNHHVKNTHPDENGDYRFHHEKITECMTLKALICQEIRTVYIIDAYYHSDEPTDESTDEPTVTTLTFDLLEFLQRVVFQAYVVKDFDQDSYDADYDCCASVLTASAWSPLRQLLPPLVIENMCEHLFYDWMKLDEIDDPTVALAFDSHFGATVTSTDYRRSLVESSTEYDRAKAFYLDFFIDNYELTQLNWTGHYVPMGTKHMFKHGSKRYVVDKLTFTLYRDS